MTTPAYAPVALALAMVTTASADFREVQILGVDFETAVVTLFNFGATDEPLDGWRACTADENQMFQYSGATGFNGFTIEAGTAFHIHWANDAKVGDPNAVNLFTLGGLNAGPLDSGPFGLSFYRTTFLFGPEDMADYVQWTDDLANPGNLTADARAQTAMQAGLWTGLADWVITAPDTTTLSLLDQSGGLLHGPSDYGIGGPTDCPADINGDLIVGVDDLLAALGQWGLPGSADITGPAGRPDGIVGIDDLLLILGEWGVCG